MKKFVLLLLFVSMGWAVQAQPVGSVLIKGATVITITKGRLANTDVLVRDGKIAEIGRNLKAPRGVRVIDASGKYLMPGIVDAHSHLAITGGVNEWTNPVTPEVQIGDVINPNDIGIYH